MLIIVYCAKFGITLPNDKILDVTKLTAFADDKLNFAKMTISLFDRVGKKHCGQRRKCWLPAFSPFSPVFSKSFFFRVVKSLDCVVQRYLKLLRRATHLWPGIEATHLWPGIEATHLWPGIAVNGRTSTQVRPELCCYFKAQPPETNNIPSKLSFVMAKLNSLPHNHDL